jgi:hypothetical protein
MKAFSFFLLYLALVIIGPLLTIASLNTLFNLSIPYEIETWAAVVWLSMITFGNVVTTIRNKKNVA